jgi:hypothetical protein
MLAIYRISTADTNHQQANHEGGYIPAGAVSSSSTRKNINMSDYCRNTLYVSGDPESLTRFKSRAEGVMRDGEVVLTGKPQPLSFHSLMSIPSKVLNAGDSRAWKSANWGSSSNAYDVERLTDSANRLIFRFSTTGFPPWSLLEHLGPKWPKLKFTLVYDLAGGYLGLIQVANESVEDLDVLV